MLAAMRDKDSQTAKVLLAGLAKEFPGESVVCGRAEPDSVKACRP